MTYELKKWALSEEVAVRKEFIKPVEGRQALYILDADADLEKGEYNIKFQSLLNNAEFKLTYYLQSAKEGKVTKNQWAYNTLIGLGSALFDDEANGVPFPDDLINGLVYGDIKMEASRKDKTKIYAKIYEYHSIDAQTYQECADAGFELRYQYTA